MNKFECSECGTKYSSPETTPPPGIKWSDGHVCTPKPVNNENDIPTAEEFLNQHLTISHFYDDITDQMVVPSSQLEQAMVDFAKIHVTQALKQAFERVNIYDYAENKDYSKFLEKESILNAYPLTNIK